MTKFFRHYFQSTNSPFGDFTNTSPPVAAEIFSKSKAMEHHASPPSSLIWLWLLVPFGEPLVSFVTALFEGRGDYGIEFTILGAVVVHHSCYLATTTGGVEGFVLFLSGLGGRYTVLGHSCHSLGVLEPPPELAVVGLNLCSLALGYHLLVGIDDAGYLFGVFADLIGEGSTLND